MFLAAIQNPNNTYFRTLFQDDVSSPSLRDQNRGINDFPLDGMGITEYLTSSSVAFTMSSVLAESAYGIHFPRSPLFFISKL